MGMKLAKASAADLAMAMELCSAMDDLTSRWAPAVPQKAALEGAEEEPERLDLDNHEQCQRVLEYMIALVGGASLMRVVYGCAVMLDPKNKCVDANADTIELHETTKTGLRSKSARPFSEWDGAAGDVLWWRFPVCEAPWIGRPDEQTWPGYHTHWTPLVVPDEPSASALEPLGESSAG